MGHLDPKPQPSKPLRGWEDLNSTLQAVFSKQYKNGEQPEAMIDSNEFSMSNEEIVSEATAMGYKVTVDSDGHHISFK